MQSFLEALNARVLVCDGAMGTMLYTKGIFVNRCFDALNLTQPDLVSNVHREYVRAGADVLETNTFGANRVKLRGFGLGDRTREINLEGARLARKAAGDGAYVAGAIGPLGIRIEPWGKTGIDEAEAFFREQVEALLEGGVDLFILETFRDLSEMGAAIRAVRAACNLPVVAQMTIEEDGNSLDGTPPEEFAPALEALGVWPAVSSRIAPGENVRAFVPFPLPPAPPQFMGLYSTWREACHRAAATGRIPVRCDLDGRHWYSTIPLGLPVLFTVDDMRVMTL